MKHSSSPAASSPSTPLYSYSPQSSPVTKTPTFLSSTVAADAFASANAAGGGDHGLLARQNPTDYERIRVVGKGSFGMAVLYRRRDDDSLVILKEINLHQLSPSEREMALNEVALLSRLDHPHIIAYYDSFEEEGTLMIEMEYADGGNLAQLLAKQSGPVPEPEVRQMFEQMVSALAYIHDNGIMHRDLKTANVFLTKERMVKIGDFGVSKKMGTQTLLQGAKTILGTPYYLSPEMCQGRPYNEKSDIWALGCCLHEMCSLRKAFDADNLPALIQKIVNSDYEPLKGAYSQELRLLIRDLLKADPGQRPSAYQVHAQLSCSQQMDKGLGKYSKTKRSSAPPAAFPRLDFYSALYRFDMLNSSLSAVQELPVNVQIKQIAISSTHSLLLTASGQVISWGDNRFGQLGHGDRKSRSIPTLVDALRGKSVFRLAAGKGFSLFCADKGILMAAGSRQFVGVGQSSAQDLLRPKILDTLLKEDVIDVCCGEKHAAVLTEGGCAFVWGCGANGRLGTGDTKDVFVPTRVPIPTRQLINRIVCGPNSTMLVTNCGTVLAMGSNEHNKLNLNQRIGFFANAKKDDIANPSEEVEQFLSPTPVKAFPCRVVDASLGANHSGVLLENGSVHLFGLNTSGELGQGNLLPNCWARPVKALLNKPCLHLICGDRFTVVGTVDSEIYFWGMGGRVAESGESGEGPKQQQQKEGAQQQKGRPKPAWELDQTKEGWELKAQNRPGGVVLQPKLVFRLDTCRTGSAQDSARQRPSIGLTALVGSGKHILMAVDVSINKGQQQQDGEQKGDQEKEKRPKGKQTPVPLVRRRSAPDAQSLKGVETWIRKELDNAEFIPYSEKGTDELPAIGQQQKTNNKLVVSERRLRAEIEQLKSQFQEQKSTFRGHEKQMALLQAKMAELQNLLRQQQGILALPPINEPPPAYSGAGERPAKPVLRNPFVPSPAVPNTRACAIL